MNTVKGINATKEPPQANKQDVAPVNNAGKEADIPHNEDEVIDKLLEKQKNVFIGEGKIKGQWAKIHIREDITPVLQPQRRISYHMRKAFSKELETLIAQEIIEPVIDQPTLWISPIGSVPKKDGGTRIYVDMREANNAIIRERQVMPTLDDFQAAMNGLKYFSKIDLKQAYHPVLESCLKR